MDCLQNSIGVSFLVQNQFDEKKKEILNKLLKIWRYKLESIWGYGPKKLQF